MEDEYTPRNERKMNRTTVLFIALAAIFIGTLAGIMGHSMFSEPVVIMPPAEIIKQELTEAELRELASDLIASEQDKAKNAQARIQLLEGELQAKEAELRTLKGNKAKNSARRNQLQEELAFLRVQLAAAEEERDALRKELKQTIKELDFQVSQSKKFKRKAKRYKMESTSNLWSAFKANAKTKICNRGTKKRHDKCYAAVDEAMGSQVRGRFTVCVDTYQSVPVLKFMEKGAAMPRYSEKLNQDSKFTKKWYVLFCDPTLPEASDRDLEGDDVPTYKSTYGTLDDEEDEFGSAPSTPEGGREELDEPIDLDEELDLDDIDLNFE
ncbi:MAG: hypothetical protein ACPGTU_01460 [Myxococcota bacterium]